jgi:hypothetical protein
MIYGYAWVSDRRPERGSAAAGLQAAGAGKVFREVTSGVRQKTQIVDDILSSFVTLMSGL